MYLQTRIVSSLEKVFCSERLDAESIDRLVLLRVSAAVFRSPAGVKRGVR